MVVGKEYSFEGKIEHYEDIKKRERIQSIERLLNKRDLSAPIMKILKNYHASLQRRGFRLESQKAYVQNARLFLLDIKKEPKKITKKDIDDYLAYIEGKYMPKTIKERKLSMIYFLEFVYNKPKDKIPLISDIKIKKVNGTKLPEEILSPEDIKKMTQVAQTIRDKAIIMLLYESGARKGEFLQACIKHVEIIEKGGKKFGFITLPMGKTTSRKVPIIYSLPHVLEWLNSHPHRDNPNAPLFITLGSYLGRGLGEDGLKLILKKTAKRAGITKKIYPHLFRHSRMTELAGILMEQELKKFAGWTPQSNMAAVYVHLSGSDVSNKILANAGVIDFSKGHKAKAVLMQIECPSCGKLNSNDVKYCKCGRILDIKEAQMEVEKYKKEQGEFDILKEQMERMNKQYEDLVKKQGEVTSANVSPEMIKQIQAVIRQQIEKEAKIKG